MNQNDIFENGHKLPLLEQFYSIQGEGFHTGGAAYFIRLGGCDIGCNWCDTKFSWHFNTEQLINTDEIIINALQHPAKSLVVTGGEPLLYPLDYLTGELKKHNIMTYLETSGCHRLSGQWDWICLSPKAQSPPLENIYDIADELKVIIENENDFEWAEHNAAKVKPDCILYLQPEWSRFNKIIHTIVEYIKINPKWRISLQTHKFMKIL